MNYDEAVQYIYRISWTERKRGLDRIRTLLGMMGNPQRDLKFIHIAGTNGKGSTAAMLYSILRSAGYKTGIFTSPHLLRLNERMQVDGKMIGDEELAEITTWIAGLAEDMDEQPTIFEMFTAIGMEYFKRSLCDIVVLEVGMGGVHDSTNVIGTPELAVITAIDFDHMAQLGNTLAEIAAAKAGIIKNNSTVVVYGGPDEVCDVFRRVCTEHGAELTITDFEHLHPTEHGTFCFDGFEGEYNLALLGEYQLRNASVSMTAVKQMRLKGYEITDEQVRKGLSGVVWRARFERILDRPEFIIDGAHNPQGIRAAAESLRRYYSGRRIVFLLGILKDKAVDDMLKILSAVSDTYITLTPDSSRAMSASELAEKINAQGRSMRAYAFEDVREGILAAVEEAGEDGVVCSLGSLYLAGTVREAALDLYKR